MNALFSSNPVRYFDGQLVLREQDVAAGGFGAAFGHSRLYKNENQGDFNVGQGWNWNVETWPRLAVSPYESSTLALFGHGRAVWFRETADDTFLTLHGDRDVLTHDAVAGEYTIAGADGSLLRFHDLADADRPGGFLSLTSPGGRVTEVFDESDGRILAVRRSETTGGVTTEEELSYDYLDTGENLDQLAGVTLRRRVDAGAWEPISQAEYAYYGSEESHGLLNDLKTAERFDYDGTDWQSLGVQYYRYWTSDSGVGMEHGLRYALKAESYARLAAVTDPLTATNAVVAQYADHYFEFDDERRVTKETVDGGSRTMTFEYYDNPNYAGGAAPFDPNAWYRRTIETRADGSEVVVYCNIFGQTLLRAERDGIDEWVEFHRLDADGQPILHAAPSAVSGYSEWLPDLVGYNESTGAATHLRANEGVIRTTVYYDAETDWEAAGLVHQRFVQRGTAGPPHIQSEREYAAHTGGGRTVYPVLKETLYRGEHGSGPVSTLHEYAFHPGTTQVATHTRRLPIVPAARGGSGTADATVNVFDVDGFNTWSKDVRGVIRHRTYDVATGAMTQSIEDVDTTLVAGVPAGWVTPAGGGSHLVTDLEHDARGRVTQTLGPVHEALVGGSPVDVRTASWTVYKDADRETVSAAGYRRVSDGSDVLINPVSITKRDKNGNVLEEITAKATVAGPPQASDTYAQSDYLAWTTHAYTDCCKLASTRVYHTIPATGEGSAGTNYDETTFGYDLRDRRNRTVSPGGTISVSLFDSRGQVTATYVGTDDVGATATDPTGAGTPGNDMVLLTQHEYDDGLDAGDGNLTRVAQHVDAATTRVTEYEYDWRNRQTAIDGELQFYQKSYYDNLSRVVRTERYDTTAAGRLLSRDGTLYDDRGRVFKRVRHEVEYDTGLVGGSIVHEYEHDAAGNRLRETPSGAAEFMAYAYDSLGRRVGTTDPLGHTTATAYDDAGNAVSATDRVDETSTRAHDPLGRLAEAADPLGNATAYDYDDAGRQAAVTDPRGYVTTTAYDAAGRRVAVTDPLSNTKTFEYDADGNQTVVTTPLGHVTTREYDRRGRLASTTDSAGAVTQQAYDRVGEVVSETDAKGQSTTHAYDALGRKISTTDRLNHTTTFSYDALDRLASLTDAEGGVTAYAFDGFGRKARETYPDHVPGSAVGTAGYGVVELTHDDIGRLVRRTDQLGDTVTHLYDAAGRRITREYRLAANSPTGTISDQDDFAYDDDGRLLSATKGRYANAIAYSYDAAGQIVSESLTTDGQTYTIGRGYDASGNLDELTYPDGTVVDRPHDARGLLASVSYGGSTVASFAYDDGGRETTRTFGNGLTTTTSYVPNDDLLESLATPGVGAYSYAYDANKNRTSEAISGVMSDYGYTTGPAGYDAEDRLVSWERSDGNLDQDWLLTPVGDWDQFAENATIQSRAHNAVHELTAIDGTGLTYDPKGNLTADHLGRSFAWDQDNMLQSCTVASGATVGQEGTHSYAYDAIGRRVSKTVDEGGGTFSTTVYSELTLPIPPLGTPGGQTLCEYAAGAAAASPQRSYAFGSYCDEPLVMDDGTDQHYYHRDGRYSVVALTNATGAVAERYGYDAYGQRQIADATGATLAASATGNDWGFSGRRHEADSRLQYFRARYYSVELGRFILRDDANRIFLRTSLYELADASPLYGQDPSGLTSWKGATRQVCNKKCRGKVGARKVTCMRNCPGKYPQEIFDHWYGQDLKLGDWWDEEHHDLSPCPKRLDMGQDGKTPSNPDPEKWLQPAAINAASKGGHPGGEYEMRSRPNEDTGSGNQCVYDICGLLIKEPPGAGTADLTTPSNPLVALTHYDVDVAPFWAAADLDGCREGETLLTYKLLDKEGCPGANMKKYFERRPAL